jgi:hypothetical protein
MGVGWKLARKPQNKSHGIFLYVCRMVRLGKFSLSPLYMCRIKDNFKKYEKTYNKQ